MIRMLIIVAVVACASLMAPAQSATSGGFSDRVREQLRSRIEDGVMADHFVCHDELICGSAMIPRFYAARDFGPAWSDEEVVSTAAQSLMEAIDAAEAHGLKEGDYHLASLESLLGEIRRDAEALGSSDPGSMAELDLLLTDAFLMYASHLMAGRVNPETIHAQWIAHERTADLKALLNSALEAGAIKTTLEGLVPTHEGYERLKRALARYREIATEGGWPSISPGPRMEQGVRDDRVGLLRLRLRISGDLPAADDTLGDLYDAALEQAVGRFQRRHGLEVDGIVGPRTLAALNEPVEARVRRIELNIERWRWLPRDLGARRVLVNIANFQLAVVEDEKAVMTMRAVVGRKYRQTPVFRGWLRFLVLNPYWHIPPRIAKRDILPKIRKDAGYLNRQKIRVFQSWGEGAPEIDPSTVDWSTIDARKFTYKLRQEPGSMNALGRIKFMFPNKFDVYIHDTPKRELFRRTLRGFSSGCIRIERPIDLAEYLLRDDPIWTRDRIEEAVKRGVKQVIRLPEPVAVDLLYWTAWVDDHGTVHFRDDIYDRDARLSRALEERPPSPWQSQEFVYRLGSGG